MIYGPYSSSAAGRTGQPDTRAGVIRTPAGRTTFHDVLRQETARPQDADVKLSKHAQSRMSDRGISLDADGLARLQRAVDMAASKGSRESVVLLDGSAFVVSVPQRTVVTVMDVQAMQESVVTNIDSFVWAGPDEGKPTEETPIADSSTLLQEVMN